MGHSMSCFSPLYFQPITELSLKHWLLIGWRKTWKRNQFHKMFPSLCKLLLIIVLKEQHNLHIVTFLYQVIVIVLHAIWPKSENVKRIFFQSNSIFIVSAWLTANPYKDWRQYFTIFGHLNNCETPNLVFDEIILKINSASCTFTFNRRHATDKSSRNNSPLITS